MAHLDFRWQLLYRIANGGILHKGDIYLRDWSIRNELQHRAYIYNVGIKSLQYVSLVKPAERQNSDISRDHLICRKNHPHQYWTTIRNVWNFDNIVTMIINSNTAINQKSIYYFIRIPVQERQQISFAIRVIPLNEKPDESTIAIRHRKLKPKILWYLEYL